MVVGLGLFAHALLQGTKAGGGEGGGAAVQTVAINVNVQAHVQVRPLSISPCQSQS